MVGITVPEITKNVCHGFTIKDKDLSTIWKFGPIFNLNKLRAMKDCNHYQKYKNDLTEYHKYPRWVTKWNSSIIDILCRHIK